jgi:ABC-type transport system involved in multi-copper enzyme maturation permease subunit
LLEKLKSLTAIAAGSPMRLAGETTLFAGPIFSREALTSPRQFRHYLIRSGYVAALFVLMYTAGQATFGWQQVRNVGDLARFGSFVFQIFSLVQITLVLFFALLFAAGSVAQEKDRRTLILLLMTDLRDRELVLGKLWASLLIVAVLLAASAPVFVLVHSLGGVSLDQIAWSLAICASTALAAGSWGSLVAYWREKTFQTLAISVLGTVLFLGIVEAVISLAGSGSDVGQWAAFLNPYRTLASILDPLGLSVGTESVAKVSALGPVLTMIALSVVLNAVAIFRLRVWNPSRSVFEAAAASRVEALENQNAPVREIWSNPVVWREICTRAYGRKVFVIKLAYVVLAIFAGFYLSSTAGRGELVLGMISPVGFVFVGLSLVSLMLINAQAVTALTSERDSQTLELFLMTDVSAKEFIFGKLGGILYNTKELIVIPLGLVAYFAFQGGITFENYAYLIIGFLVLVAFASMLGLHSGLSFENSRSAIANSLGTMFFLFTGIFIFMMLLVEARSSFFLQFQSFIVFIGAGSIALYASLSHKNPSVAFRISAGVLPFLTFYAITEFLLSGTLGVCFSISVAYGFTTLAMLIPAISEFDVALGRTTLDKG